MQLSIIIPTYQEAGLIEATLEPLQSMREQGVEVILADGGSTDDTVAVATPMIDKVVISSKGRARQMNAGADVAIGDWLLFLHADTRLPDNSVQLLTAVADTGHEWGFFYVRLSGKHPLLRWVEFGINNRSRITQVATGDQAIFVERRLWSSLQGFADLTLMEDVEISKRLRRRSPPYVVRTPLTTSSRRWENNGIVRTILLMWWLRLLYFLGVDVKYLARLYRQ